MAIIFKHFKITLPIKARTGASMGGGTSVYFSIDETLELYHALTFLVGSWKFVRNTLVQLLSSSAAFS